MSTYSTEGIVLKRSSFGESSLIVHIFSKDFGKIDVVAKSACKHKGKLKGHLEPLLLCDFIVVNGRKLDTIANSFVLNDFINLRNDFLSTVAGLGILEIADKMTIEGYSDIRVFDLLSGCLKFLDSSCVGNREKTLLTILFFEMNFLSLSGFCPHIDKCVFCGEKIFAGKNKFSFSLGGVLHEKCSVNYPDSIFVDDDVLKLIRLLDLNELSQEAIDAKLGEILKVRVKEETIFRSIFMLRDFISFNLDKKINSFEVLYNCIKSGNF